MATLGDAVRLAVGGFFTVIFLFLGRGRGGNWLFRVGVSLSVHSKSDSEHCREGKGSNLFHGAVSIKSSSKVGKIPGRTSLKRPVWTYSASKLRK